MEITIQEVQTKKQRKAFARLPFMIYKGNEYWVPPMLNDEINIITPEKNPACRKSITRFWTAHKDGKTVGRIGAIINEAYNEKVKKKIGKFSRFECVNDSEVAQKLFATAEQFLRDNGMDEVQGPLGFSNLDLQGMLVEGFDHLQSIGSVYHQSYYKDLLAENGYEKEIDWVEFRLTLPDEVQPKALRLNDLIKKRYNLRVLNFNKSSELKPYTEQLFGVLNNAFSELFSFFSFDEETIRFYIKKYFSFINPQFIKVILDKDDNMLAFLVAIPSLAKAMQKAKGKLLPFGWWHILRAQKKNDTMDLFLTGVNPEKQGLGLPALLITEMLKTAISFGIKEVETTGIFETNNKAITHWKEYKHIQHKRKRCFRKKL